MLMNLYELKQQEGLLKDLQKESGGNLFSCYRPELKLEIGKVFIDVQIV